MGDQLLLTVLTTSALLGAGLWAVLHAERHRGQRAQRLKTITTTSPTDELTGASLRRPLPRAGRLRALFSQPAGLWARLEAAFAAAGNRIGLPELVSAGIAAAAVTGFAARFMGFSPALVVLLSAAAAVAAARSLLRFAQIRYQRRFLDVFPDAIDLIVRALRSGLPVSEAIVGAGHEISDPVGAELRLVENGMRMGRDLESLLWDTAKRIDSPEFRFFTIALSVQRETGGNLAETLANLSDILRRRKQARAKAHAMASETRATTMILGGLPVAVIGVMSFTSPHYLLPLINDVRGMILDGIAVTMLITGIAIMNKMAKFEI